MRKLLLLLLVLSIAMPLMAQEEGEGEMMMAPPPPLDNDYFSWLVGEWKGWSEGDMGKSEDAANFSMAFGDQFLMLQYQATSDMGEFSGGGVFTVNQDGGIEAYWVDSMRDMGKGKGSIEGDVMTMHWESKMGKGTRVTKKISDDKLEVTSSWEMPDGTVMKGKSEMTRVKMMTDK